MAIYRSPWANSLKLGQTAPGSKLYFYEVGTTTPKAVQKTEGGADHPHPVVADSNGIFPLIYGDGAYKVILKDSNDATLATVDSYTFETSVESLEGSLTAPSGTVMAFFQSSAPSGWSQVTNHDNKMLRVVSGTGGGSGGSDSPINYSQDLSHTHGTGDHTLTTSEMPSHTHDVTIENTTDFDSTVDTIGGNFSPTTPTATKATSSVGGDSAHNHGDTDSASLTASFTPKFIDMILCQAD